MGKNVCFLGYDRHQTRIVDAIEARGCDVHRTSCRMEDFSAYDVVISFGYRHIIRASHLRTLRRPAINLHIAYLPYNRGMHPNFWSWMESSPSGVTIHEIDAGLDTGPICFQKRCSFDKAATTFSATYRVLIEEIENLFVENIEDLLEGSYVPRPQNGPGSFHKSSDLPKWMDDWNMSIEAAVQRYSDNG